MVDSTDDLRSQYSKLFYQLEVTQYFKQILKENIYNRSKVVNKLMNVLFTTRKKKQIINLEKAELNAMINSYKHYSRSMVNLLSELTDVQNHIRRYRRDLIEDEKTINERIFSCDPHLDAVTKPFSEEIIDNIQELYNINEALVLCDLIRHKVKDKYEVCEIVGIHKDVTTVYENDLKLDDLLRELSTMISLINRRLAYRETIHRVTSEIIKDKISINYMDQIVSKLLAHMKLLEDETIELKETRIKVIQKYCD